MRQASHQALRGRGLRRILEQADLSRALSYLRTATSLSSYVRTFVGTRGRLPCHLLTLTTSVSSKHLRHDLFENPRGHFTVSTCARIFTCPT